jgi:hypothetical protein
MTESEQMLSKLQCEAQALADEYALKHEAWSNASNADSDDCPEYKSMMETVFALRKLNAEISTIKAEQSPVEYPPIPLTTNIYQHKVTGVKRKLIRERQHSVTYANVTKEGRVTPSTFVERKRWDVWFKDTHLT